MTKEEDQILTRHGEYELCKLIDGLQRPKGSSRVHIAHIIAAYRIIRDCCEIRIGTTHWTQDVGSEK